MRGKIILRLALLSVLTVSIYSCRTEDEVLPQEEQSQFRAPIEMFLKFEEKAQADPEFKSQNRQQTSGQTNQKNASYNTSPVNIPISQVSYKLPFRETIESFFQNNPALGLEFYKDFGNPFYNVSTYTYGDSSKAIAFPILQGDRVTAFIHGIVTPNRDYVQFTIVQNNDPVTLRVLAILQDAVDNLYPKNPTPMGKFAKEQNIRVNDIEEITIIKFNVFSGGGGGFGYMFPGREWWKDSPWKEANGAHLGSGGGKAMSGDGSKHKFPDYLDPEDDPCEKAKKMFNKPYVQKGINDIKAQALKTLSDMNTGEIGFKEKKDGSLAPADVNGNHKVVFNDVTDSYGGYHNHTATGTHMFSPPDIVDALFGFAAAQSAQDGVGNAYLGMIAAEWCNTCPNNAQYIHYVIKYTGTGSELGGYVYTPAQMNQFEDDYRKIVKNLKNKYVNGTTYINVSEDLNEKGLEKIFFETLKVIGINGKVNLQRIEANGSVNNITLNSDGIPIAKPCPN
ncbi:hypothetical protein [Chryseobacterium sp. BIGb0232]|uniref:hypothetical protein n=1 Tax=Chryseobacterium sp. BIGb0232 TaxID=2940598 RepID=UPI000F48A3CA|nr:hypothetical protein [Chryseobacterium sp. BIGb0232]MCS4303721.1 hypothetical protein [Chryseobacterium sp. BIGb0232]ROS10419.1 hypothetical protein EDF65_4301 [Chryseobacterium nakagawai]